MRFFFFLLALLMSLNCYAQRHNANWCFGQNAGFNFMGNTSGSAPHLIAGPFNFTPAINTLEGAASISNSATGTLMFYYNKGALYDKNYSLMPNSTNITTDKLGTCAQGVNIVPVVSDRQKFYVFTLSDKDSGGVLSYSIVDSTLNGGLGDVIAGQKAIRIDTGFSEAMTVVEGCKGYWLIVYKWLSGSFYAYRISSSGISPTPVISATAYPRPAGSVALIKVSPDRRSLGLTSRDGSFVAMHDFNTTTGLVSNDRIIDTSISSGAGFYGCEFSTNSRRFYVSALNKKDVYQYDLSLATTNAVIASRQTVHHDTLAAGALQLGPDGYIYVAMVNANRLDVIWHVDALFPGCSYNQMPPFATSGVSLMGLPQKVVRPIQHGGDSAFVSLMDKSDCLNPPAAIYGPKGMLWYKWQDGSTKDSLVVTTPNTFWVTSFDGCATFGDTINMIGAASSENHSVTDSICPGESLMLFHYRDLDQLGSTWIWNTGSTHHSISVSEAGTYWVVMNNKTCHTSIDTFHVIGITIPFTPTRDTAICLGDTLNLPAGIFPNGTHITWSNGDTGLVTKAYDKGIYSFVAAFQGCKLSDEIELTQPPQINIELGQSREVCSDEIVTLPEIVTSEHGDKYKWQDGSTGRSFTVKELGRYYVEVVGYCQTLRDTIDITVRSCHLFFPSAFSPNGDGKNDLAHLIGDIANVSQYELHIYNRWGQEVFVGNDVYTGWDGAYKEKPAEMGTYYYYMNFRYRSRNEMMKGDITLIR